MNIKELSEKVHSIDSAINCHTIEGYTIEGNYRGKKSERFKYNCKTHEFDYNTCKPAVAAAFEQAVKELI
jgi:hypothetical protein